MEKIKSLADLKRIKENVQTKIDLREKSEQVENLILNKWYRSGYLWQLAGSPRAVRTP